MARRLLRYRGVRATEARTGGFYDLVTMKLIDALKIVSKKPRLDSQPLNAALVCGFTPLHLQTLLHAELQLHFPDRQVEIKTGLYGDIVGTLSGFAAIFPTLSEEE